MKPIVINNTGQYGHYLDSLLYFKLLDFSIHSKILMHLKHCSQGKIDILQTILSVIYLVVQKLTREHV